jgi:preprotein translocase subunit YajC
MFGTVDFVTLAVNTCPTGSGGGSMQMMIMMALIFGIMYFMMIRPQQRKEKARREMINNLKSGTRVVFSGGIMGTVTNVKDGTFVIKIADGVKIEVARGAVSRILEKGEKLTEEDNKK